MECFHRETLRVSGRNNPQSRWGDYTGMYSVLDGFTPLEPLSPWTDCLPDQAEAGMPPLEGAMGVMGMVQGVVTLAIT